MGAGPGSSHSSGVADRLGRVDRKHDQARHLHRHHLLHRRPRRPPGRSAPVLGPGPGGRPGRPRHPDARRPPRHRAGRVRAERADARPDPGGVDGPADRLPVSRPPVASGADGRADRHPGRHVVGAVHRPDRARGRRRPVPGHGSRSATSGRPGSRRASRVVQALLRGETVDSELLGVDGARIAPLPPDGTEWWIGGGVPVAIDRAARLGDCWYGNADLTPGTGRPGHRRSTGRPAPATAASRSASRSARTCSSPRAGPRPRRSGDALMAAGYRGFDREAVAYGDPDGVAEQLAVFGELGLHRHHHPHHAPLPPEIGPTGAPARSSWPARCAHCWRRWVDARASGRCRAPPGVTLPAPVAGDPSGTSDRLPACRCLPDGATPAGT